jgi:hypothetical protein
MFELDGVKILRIKASSVYGQDRREYDSTKRDW